jgi:DNA (cytosine-5)-methyltransferase 1
VEWDAYAASVLVARQNDGCLEPFPIWDDIRSFDGGAWRGRVDVVSGGFPCQDISCAGKGAGIDGERSGMWVEMARVIGEVGPRFVLVENSPMLTVRGLGRVLGDLVALGYDAVWGVYSAADVGARHQRERLWIMAYTMQDGQLAGESINDESEGGNRASAFGRGDWFLSEVAQASDRALEQSWTDFADAARDPDAVADWMDRLATTGNGQVPAVVRLAWESLGGIRGDFNDRSDRSDDDFRGGLKPELQTKNQEQRTKNDEHEYTNKRKSDADEPDAVGDESTRG